MRSCWQGFFQKISSGGKLSLSKIEAGGRTSIILKSILSLRHNSGGAKPFLGGRGSKMPLLSPIENSLMLGYDTINRQFVMFLQME